MKKKLLIAVCFLLCHCFSFGQLANEKKDSSLKTIYGPKTKRYFLDAEHKPAHEVMKTALEYNGYKLRYAKAVKPPTFTTSGKFCLSTSIENIMKMFKKVAGVNYNLCYTIDTDKKTVTVIECK